MDEMFDAERVATTCNYDGRLSRDAVHRIDITLRRHGQSGPHYRVVYLGQTLVESTKEPLFEACRALVALGHAGRLEMWGGELYPRMIVRDIEQAAKFTVVENVNAGPRFARYRPHPGTTDGDDAE
jgi:hypothetical protein